jgi:hypothetical protein
MHLFFNQDASLFNLFQMVAILIGIMFFGQELTEDGVMNINGALFLFLTNMTFQNVFAVINVRKIALNFSPQFADHLFCYRCFAPSYQFSCEKMPMECTGPTFTSSAKRWQKYQFSLPSPCCSLQSPIS